MSRVWQLVLNVWHGFPEEPRLEWPGPAGGDAWVFSAFLPLLAAGKHFPSLDFSFVSGGWGMGISLVLRIFNNQQKFLAQMKLV